MIKKLILMSLFCLMSCHVYAASSASAIFTNFNVSVLTGEAPDSIFDTFSSNVNHNLYSAGNQNYLYDFQSSQLPASILLNTTLDSSLARSVAEATGLNWSFESFSTTSSGSADSNISSGLSFQYKANSLLRFTGDALISGFGNLFIGEGADSSVTMSLFNSSFDNAFLINSYSSSLQGGIGLGQNYLVSKKLQIFYYDDKDSFLQVNVTTSARATSYSSAPPIPEPTTNAMLIFGIGLLCYKSRRKLV